MTDPAFARTHYDAIVVGARCAGAATALQIARAGGRVLVVDRERPGTDTLSTHALMRPAVALLDALGLIAAVERAGTPVIRTTSFSYGDETIPIAIKPEGGAQGLYAPRRFVLDRILAEAAEAAGAELHHGLTFRDVLRGPGGRVRGAVMTAPDSTRLSATADIVIGADGRTSAVARAVGAPVRSTARERGAVLYGYFKGIANEGTRWYFGHGNYAGAIPTNDGAHCVFAAVRPEVFKSTFAADPVGGIAGVIAQCDPALAEGLKDLPRAGHLRRFAGAPGHIRACAGPGWALVGDAGYFKDPATAHGITDAFLDAHRLVAALRSQPSCPTAYQRTRDAVAAPMFDIARKIAALDWTFDALKALHQDLNRCIKSEMAELRTAPRPAATAA